MNLRANQVQSPLSTIPSASQNKLPLSNYKYSRKSSLGSGIPLPRLSSPRSILAHGTSRQSLSQQEFDTKTFSTEDNVTILGRTGSNSNLGFERHVKKGDYSSDESSNLSGEWMLLLYSDRMLWNMSYLK